MGLLDNLELGLDVESLGSLTDVLNDAVDEINAARGSDGGGRVTYRNKIVADKGKAYATPIEQVMTAAGGLGTTEEVIAFVYGIHGALTEKYGADMNKVLDALIAANKTEKTVEEALEVTNDKVREVQECLKMWDSIYAVLEMRQTEDLEDWKERRPANPRLVSATTGNKAHMQVSKNYQYYIKKNYADPTEEWERREQKFNNLGSIANHECNDLDWKVGDIRDWMGSNGFNWDDPPRETWEAELPNKKGLRAEMTGETETVVTTQE